MTRHEAAARLLITCGPLGDGLVLHHERISRHREPELAGVEIPTRVKVVLRAGTKKNSRPCRIGRVEQVRASLKEANTCSRVVDGEGGHEDEALVALRHCAFATNLSKKIRQQSKAEALVSLTRDHIEHLQVFHPPRRVPLQLQPRRLGQRHPTDN